MSDDNQGLYTHELAKNAKKSSHYEGFGALTGAALGAVLAVGSRLSGWQAVSRMIDTTFTGWVIGMILGTGAERRENQAAALQMDAGVIKMAHENAYLRDKVLQLSGETHAEKLHTKRSCDCDTPKLPRL